MFRAAFFLLPLAAVAQTPPPEVDQALRARVSEFFQYYVDGTFRKAEALVAEDTKDYYFAAEKIRFTSFKIVGINYSDDFTKAEVTVAYQRMWRVGSQFPETLVTVPLSSTWKIEDGKWVWYHDPNAKVVRQTPMGLAVAGQAESKPAGTAGPPDLSQKAITAAGQQILNQVSGGPSKSEVTLATGRASSDQVVFHNGAPGAIEVKLTPTRKIPGFTAVLDKTDLNAGEDATLTLTYEPDQPDQKREPPPVTLQLTVQPFNKTFPISVTFTAAQ